MTAGSSGTPFDMVLNFDPVLTPGDLPPLQVLLPGIQGTNTLLRLSTLRNGSTDLFYGPIASDMLSLPVTFSNTVEVVASGVRAACVAASPNASCAYNFSSAQTPAITSLAPLVSPYVVTLTTSPVALTLTGTGFSAVLANNVVNVGSMPCVVTSATATQVRRVLRPCGWGWCYRPSHQSSCL